jgi:hypothetical protein
MQEILTWIIVFAAVTILAWKTTQSLKSFKKTDDCNGCGGGCCGCPVSPANRKSAGR